MNVLVTGAYGFLGRHMAANFAASGHKVIGCGRGVWAPEEFARWGVSEWYQGDIDVALLRSIEGHIDVIVHCAGGGSVGAAHASPLDDFQSTVAGLYEVLIYIKDYSSATRLIYPSSPAVQGAHDETPFRVDDAMQPVSVYGVHKKIAEELCGEFSKLFNLDIYVARLFSVYGTALRKQLLWDACSKLIENRPSVSFFGTGGETRDFVHVDDVARLFINIATADNPALPRLMNCGSGRATTVAQLVSLLKQRLKVSSEIGFSGQSKPGDPCFYQACLVEAEAFGWTPTLIVEAGLDEYVEWFVNER